jgi:hypothetical protein
MHCTIYIYCWQTRSSPVALNETVTVVAERADGIEAVTTIAITFASDATGIGVGGLQ